jgi:hypothetical protein
LGKVVQIKAKGARELIKIFNELFDEKSVEKQTKITNYIEREIK